MTPESMARGLRQIRSSRFTTGTQVAQGLARSCEPVVLRFATKGDRVKDGITKKALLVVDDDVEWTDLLRVFFSNKYAVAVANHADQAMEAIRREAPHVIILDLIMPSVDGFGLMHRMKDILPKTVPTVLTTGWGGSDLKESAESVGCVAVLSKPVSLTELETLVSSLMDGSYKVASQIGPETSVNAAQNTEIGNRNYER